MWRWQPTLESSHSSNTRAVLTWFQLMNDSDMDNKYEIELEDDLNHVRVNGKRLSIIDAADIFHVRMLNTLQAMEDGVVSRAIEVIVKEVTP